MNVDSAAALQRPSESGVPFAEGVFELNPDIFKLEVTDKELIRTSRASLWFPRFEIKEVEAEFNVFSYHRHRSLPVVMGACMVATAPFFASGHPAATAAAVSLAVIGLIAIFIAAKLWAHSSTVPRWQAYLVAEHHDVFTTFFGLLFSVGTHCAASLALRECWQLGAFRSTEGGCQPSFGAAHAAVPLLTAAIVRDPLRNLVVQFVAIVVGVFAIILIAEQTISATTVFNVLLMNIAVSVVTCLYATWYDATLRRHFRVLCSLFVTEAALRFEHQRALQIIAGAMPAAVAHRLATVRLVPVNQQQGLLPPAVQDNSTTATVSITQTQDFDRWSTSVLLVESLRDLHHAFTLFDVASAQFGVDRGGTYGDSYSVTAGLVRSSGARPLNVLRFAVWQLQVGSRLALASAVTRGAASSTVMSATTQGRTTRYAIAGPAVTECSSLLRRAAPGELLISPEAAVVAQNDDFLAVAEGTTDQPCVRQPTDVDATSEAISRTLGNSAASATWVSWTDGVDEAPRSGTTYSTEAPLACLPSSPPIARPAGFVAVSVKRGEDQQASSSPPPCGSAQQQETSTMRSGGDDSTTTTTQHLTTTCCTPRAVVALARALTLAGSSTSARDEAGVHVVSAVDSPRGTATSATVAMPPADSPDGTESHTISCCPNTFAIRQDEAAFALVSADALVEHFPRAAGGVVVLAVAMGLTEIIDHPQATATELPVYVAYGLLVSVLVVNGLVLVVERCRLRRVHQQQHHSFPEDASGLTKSVLERAARVSASAVPLLARALSAWRVALVLGSMTALYFVSWALRHHFVGRDPWYLAFCITTILTPDVGRPFAFCGLLFVIFVVAWAPIFALKLLAGDGFGTIYPSLVLWVGASQLAFVSTVASRRMFRMELLLRDKADLAEAQETAIESLGASLVPAHAAEECTEALRQKQLDPLDRVLRTQGVREALAQLTSDRSERKPRVRHEFRRLAILAIRLQPLQLGTRPGATFKPMPSNTSVDESAGHLPTHPQQDVCTSRFADPAAILELLDRLPCCAGDILDCVRLLGDDVLIAGSLSRAEDSESCAAPRAMLCLLAHIHQASWRMRGLTAVLVADEATGAQLGHGVLRYDVFGVAVRHATALLDGAPHTVLCDGEVHAMVTDGFLRAVSQPSALLDDLRLRSDDGRNLVGPETTCPWCLTPLPVVDIPGPSWRVRGVGLRPVYQLAFGGGPHAIHTLLPNSFSRPASPVPSAVPSSCAHAGIPPHLH